MHNVSFSLFRNIHEHFLEIGTYIFPTFRKTVGSRYLETRNAVALQVKLALLANHN